jgi:hypothetical protein
MITLRSCALFFAGIVTIFAASDGVAVQVVGGTLPGVAKLNARLDITGRQTLVFRAGKSDLTIPYDKINIIEYGQTVSRRYAAAVLVSPILLLSKARKHFVTLEYVDAEGRQQALVFRAGKSDIRALLAGLEARTGRRVEFQDDEARKSGKG